VFFIAIKWLNELFQHQCSPNAKHLGSFTRGFNFWLPDETSDVSDCSHSGSDKPRQTHQWARCNQKRQNKEVEVVAVTLLYHKNQIHIKAPEKQQDVNKWIYDDGLTDVNQSKIKIDLVPSLVEQYNTTVIW